MMHVRSLVHFLLFFPGGARRSIRLDDSHQGAQQQNNGLVVSTVAREAFIPRGFGTGIFRRAGPQSGGFREDDKRIGRRVGHLELYRSSPWFRFGPRRAKIALQASETFDTIVPSGSAAGSDVSVRTPDGQDMMVTVPDGLQPGDAFSVAYTPQPRAAPETYDEAETRGLQLAASGEYERAIRMFELAQMLPGDGVDYTREKGGGMIGSANAPPNPRGWREDRFATAEQKLYAMYNIACCNALLGDTPRALELLKDYLSKVSDPLNQVNLMLVDEDLIGLRSDLQAWREKYKTDSPQPGASGLRGLGSSMRNLAESVGVEWKDSPLPGSSGLGGLGSAIRDLAERAGVGRKDSPRPGSSGLGGVKDAIRDLAERAGIGRKD